MKKSLVLAASLALVLGACGPDHKPAVPTTAAASQLVAPAPAPAPIPPTATDAKPETQK